MSTISMEISRDTYVALAEEHLRRVKAGEQHGGGVVGLLDALLQEVREPRPSAQSASTADALPPGSRAVGPKYLTEAQAAEFLGYAAKTLQSWRAKGIGPVFYAGNNNAIRYSKHDLVQFQAIPRIPQNAPRPRVPRDPALN